MHNSFFFLILEVINFSFSKGIAGALVDGTSLEESRHTGGGVLKFVLDGGASVETCFSEAFLRICAVGRFSFSFI